MPGEAMKVSIGQSIKSNHLNNFLTILKLPIMEKTTSKVTIKYLKFLTYLYNKKHFSINIELRDYQIDTYIKNALLNYNLILGEGKNYKWVGCEPTIKEAEKVRNYCKELRYNAMSGKTEKLKQNIEKPKRSLLQQLFDEVESDPINDAIILLKSKGYKIFKPVTEFQEL